MTSLDGKGFSITLLKATPAMLEALDVPATTPGWPITPRLTLDGTKQNNKTIDKDDHAEKSSAGTKCQLKGKQKTHVLSKSAPTSS